MSAADQAVNCLAQYDSQHKEFYEKNRNRIKAFIEKLGTALDHICTEDKKFAGLEPRTDLYLRTEKRHVLIEAKLCVTSGATAGRSLIQKIASTITKILQREEADSFYVFVIIPREASQAAVENIKRSLLNEVNAVVREIGTAKEKELKWVVALDVEVPHFALNTPLRLDIKGRTVTVKIFVAPV